jgi:hypothetical protein
MEVLGWRCQEPCQEPVKRAPGPGDPNSDDRNGASSVGCQNGVLNETIPIPGTPFSLSYSSDRVAGYKASGMEVPGTTPFKVFAPIWN